MRILISNDDGIHAHGILELAKALESIAEVTVVAPHRERSTAGHCLTLHKPLRIYETRPRYFAVTGTPADCIYIGAQHIMKEPPDLIVSGINRGANLATDTFYSGTVAAAREGFLFGITSIAVSLCIFRPRNIEGEVSDDDHREPPHWGTATSFMTKFLPEVLKRGQKGRAELINVNVPNLPNEKINGVRVGHIGMRHYDKEIVECVDPRNKRYYWIGGAYKDFDKIPGSDCLHVDDGYISVVPLKTDVTDYDQITSLRNWVENE